MEKEITLPISHISYSAMAQLLRNPLIFKMKYILGVYENKMGMSGLIGQACHEALKVYYGGNENVKVPENKADRIALARDFGMEYLAGVSDSYIKYGKTGSREAMLKGYNQALDFYFAEEPEYHEIIAVEERMEAEIKTDTGDLLPLPIVGIPDLVHRAKDGKVDIIDTKFTTSFTDYDTEDYIKIMQAMFMGHLLFYAKGIRADRLLFREIKRTANQDGMPQVRDYSIPLDHEPYKIIFYNLFKDVVKFLANDPIFLPNLSDMFDGEHAGLIYAQGLINADMSDVEVMHKVRDIAFQSKKFIPSRLDNKENANLLPEEKIKMRLAEFGVPVEPQETKIGASVTQYRFKVSAGVRMSTIKKHQADIALALGVKGNITILAPIPGTSLIGVEVENAEKSAIKLSNKDLVPGTLMLPIGVDVHGKQVRMPLNEMPHLLIAGATGAGKSVLLHSLITALTKQMSPRDLKLVLIDPKRVELSAFAKKPHLEGKVIYEYDQAAETLEELTNEMERRYKILEKAGKRDITEYNNTRRVENTLLPYIVVVIDEFADFMIRAKLDRKKKKKVESADLELLVVRLAQMARAVGIHLILATQRPSVDVITGLIKANFPTRIALTTASATDSKIILGVPGAEKLSGKGDMLFNDPSARGVQRLQGYLWS